MILKGIVKKLLYNLNYMGTLTSTAIMYDQWRREQYARQRRQLNKFKKEDNPNIPRRPTIRKKINDRQSKCLCCYHHKHVKLKKTVRFSNQVTTYHIPERQTSLLKQ